MSSCKFWSVMGEFGRLLNVYVIIIHLQVLGHTVGPILANDNIIYDNLSYGYYTNATAVRAVQNAEDNWWGDATGPYHPTANPLGLGNEVSDNVDFDPYMLGNIYCDPDPEYLKVAGPTKTVAVKYLGGGGGAIHARIVTLPGARAVEPVAGGHEHAVIAGQHHQHRDAQHVQLDRAPERRLHPR